MPMHGSDSYSTDFCPHKIKYPHKTLKSGLFYRAFDLFAKPTQTRRGVINKEELKRSLVQFGSSVASEKEINKLIDTLPISEDGACSEFDYMKHINMFMG